MSLSIIMDFSILLQSGKPVQIILCSVFDRCRAYRNKDNPDIKFNIHVNYMSHLDKFETVNNTSNFCGLT